MDRAAAGALCGTFPGAELSAPFGPGHDVWKVGGKMFAAMGALNEGVSLKCADTDTAALLIEMGRALRAPYLPRGGWIMARWDEMPPDELAERLLTSYLTVRRGLTRKLQATLGPKPGPEPGPEPTA